MSSEQLRDTLKQVSMVRGVNTTSPLSWSASSADALPVVDLSAIQRTPRARFTEADVPNDATVRLCSNCLICF